MPVNRSKSRNISKFHHREKLKSFVNNKKLRHHLDKVISEFNILPEKREPLIIFKHVTKTIFWATVYLVFSYLTITSSFEVYQQYRNDKTTTNMQAIVNNNITYLPNMTICVKINSSELFDIYNSSGFDYTSAWYEFFENITFESKFKDNKRQIYDDEIYLSLHKYLAMIYEAERGWEPGLTQISTFHAEKNDDWLALKQVLVPNIERYNITLEQLKSVFDGKFCSLPWDLHCHLLLRYQPHNDEECVAGSKISFIGMDTICFRLIGYQAYLRPLGTTEPFTINLYDSPNMQIWSKEFTLDVGSESRSTPRRATVRNETDGYYYNRFSGEASVTIDLGIKAFYRKLPYVNGDLQCSSNTSREECENKCLRGWIRANCHCSPITLNLTADIFSYRSCTVDDYSICLKKYTESATSSCTNKCVPLCEHWYYEYGLTTKYYGITRSVKINPKIFNYVIIEQVFTWNSFAEFIGALGGALGIWLGLDFVIIIEFIVNLLTKLIKKIFLRNVHDSEEDKPGVRDNTKNREENIENGISSSNEAGSRVVGHQKEYKGSEIEIAGTSIRQINESRKLRISKNERRQSDAWKERRIQQGKKRLNDNIVDSAILDDNMKNINAHDRRLQNQKVNIRDNIDTVQDESTIHYNDSSARCWFLQKMLLLLLNGDASTKKSAIFLQLTEKLFWTAIYLVGSIFTTLWCADLINLYLEDEAVYYPSLITNQTVSFPPPSLCVAYEKNLFIDRPGSISNALMDYFGKSDINRESFIQVSDGKDWSEELVSIGLLYLSTLAISESGYSDVNFISYYESQLDSLAGYNNTLLRDDIDKSINDIFPPKLLEWNITANELRQKLGAELARLVELKISFTNSNGTIDIVNETSFYTAAITDEVFCYSLSNGVSFTGSDDTLVFSINSSSYLQPPIPRCDNNRQYHNYIFLSDFLLEPKSAEFDSIQYNDPTFDPEYFPFLYGMETRILISVDSLYTSRPASKGVINCSPNTTKLYCRAQCRIRLIEKLCNCSPTHWTAMIPPTSGLDECTFDRYMECLNFNPNDDLDCKDSCLPSCTARYFRTDDKLDPLPQEYSSTAVIRLSVKEGIYTSIEENPIFTFSDLLITV